MAGLARFVALALSLVLLSLLCHECLKSVLNTSMPICIVRSNSMAPAFVTGDVLIVQNGTQVEFQVGDVIVFKVPN